MTSLAHLVGMIYDLKSEVEQHKLNQSLCYCCCSNDGVEKNNLINSPTLIDADGGFYQITLDVSSFEWEDISVKVKDREIIINGEHQEREDEFGFVSRQFTRRYFLPDNFDPTTITSSLTDNEMDEMILHCNQNTVYVLNTSYTSYGEFDMIGLFGSQTGCRRTNQPLTAYKSKSKATTNLLLDNQINDKLKEVNNNLIKKRPQFFKFFHDSFFKANSIDDDTTTTRTSSPKSSSCKSTKLTGKTSQKSSKELYREAAQILGIACEYDENCRCIECQSRYFECGDDDESDTYSNLSALIDCDDFSPHVVDNDEAFFCNGDDENCTYRGYEYNDDDGTCFKQVNDDEKKE